MSEVLRRPRAESPQGHLPARDGVATQKDWLATPRINQVHLARQRRQYEIRRKSERPECPLSGGCSSAPRPGLLGASRRTPGGEDGLSAEAPWLWRTPPSGPTSHADTARQDMLLPTFGCAAGAPLERSAGGLSGRLPFKLCPAPPCGFHFSLLRYHDSDMVPQKTSECNVCCELRPNEGVGKSEPWSNDEHGRRGLRPAVLQNR